MDVPAKSILSPAHALPPVTVIPLLKLSLSYWKSSVQEAFKSDHESSTDWSRPSPTRLNGAGKLPPDTL